MVENNVYKTPLKHRMWRCSPSGHKSHRISDWKLKFKIICDYNAIYDIYIKTENCDYCGDSLVPDYLRQKRGNKSRCLDHCHSCGGVRGILCHQCNIGNKLKCEMCD